jgi:hypothetical protein
VSHVPLKDVEQLLRNGDALSRSRFGRLHHFIPERVRAADENHSVNLHPRYAARRRRACALDVLKSVGA